MVDDGEKPWEEGALEGEKLKCVSGGTWKKSI